MDQKKVKSRHGAFTISGMTARALIAASKISGNPADVVFAAGFGVVELLGAKRLWRIVWPAFRKEFLKQLHIITRRNDA